MKWFYFTTDAGNGQQVAFKERTGLLDQYLANVEDVTGHPLRLEAQAEWVHIIWLLEELGIPHKSVGKDSYFGDIYLEGLHGGSLEEIR